MKPDDQSFQDDFFPNDEADTHCLQACYQIVVAGLLGRRLDTSTAEQDTGYSDGLLTWQFAMMLSLADKHDLYVVDHEDFDPGEFSKDPIKVLREQIQDEAAVQHQVENSDLPAEAARASACLSNSRVSFHRGSPTLVDLTRVVSQGARVICLINGAILDDNPGYRPHFVVVRSIHGSSVEIHDPGPPSRPNWVIPTAKFVKAWTDPSPSVSNYIAAAVGPLTY